MSLLAVSLALAGAAWGSFAATAAQRAAAGGSILHPSRSSCASCGRLLGWVELLPVAGYLLCRGRCQSCGATIPALYPLAELAGLLMALSAVLAFGDAVWRLAAALLFGAVLLAIALRDAADFIIPDLLSLPLLLLGLGATAWLEPAALPDHALAALSGGALLWLVAWLYRRRRGRDGLGLGDVKLFAALGAWLGLEGLAPCLLLAALGALGYVGLQAWFTGRPIDGAAMVPFGTWLGFAGWLVYVAPMLLEKI